MGDYGYNIAGCSSRGPVGSGAPELGLGGTVFSLKPYSSAALSELGVKVPSDMIAFGDAMSRMSGNVISLGNASLSIDGIFLNVPDSLLQEFKTRARKRHNGSANVDFLRWPHRLDQVAKAFWQKRCHPQTVEQRQSASSRAVA